MIYKEVLVIFLLHVRDYNVSLKTTMLLWTKQKNDTSNDVRSILAFPHVTYMLS